MNVSEIIAKLSKLDIQLEVSGKKLKINAPKGTLTTELQAELVERKAEIMAFLQEKSNCEIPRIKHDKNNQYLTPETIGYLIGGSFALRNQSPIINPLMMAKNLRVTFKELPKNFSNENILRFREELKIQLSEAGVQIEPWLDATKDTYFVIDIPFINQPIKLKTRAVKSNINAVIAVENKSSIIKNSKLFLGEAFYRFYSRFISSKRKISASRITQLLGWFSEHTIVEEPTNTQTITLTNFNEIFNDPDLNYQQKIPIGVKILLENKAQIVIGINSQNLSVLNMNLADSIYPREQIERFVIYSLIPKIYVPILPLSIKNFQVDVFNVEESIYAQQLIEMGKRIKPTGLLPQGFKLAQAIKSEALKDFLNWIVDGRTGVSYGFVAYGEKPIYYGKKAVSEEEWLSFIPVKDFNFDEVRQNQQGRWYIKKTLAAETKFAQIPDIWLVSARSGSEKTNLNLERDMVRIGLIKGKFTLQLPRKNDLQMLESQPSYDIFVMAAIVLSASLYMPQLIEDNGSPIFHFHGYPSWEWFDMGEYIAGIDNPSLPCGTYESGVLNFLAMSDLAMQYGNDIKLASIAEPDHGINIITGNMEYLLTRLEAGINQGQIELGGKHFHSLKENLA